MTVTIQPLIAAGMAGGLMFGLAVGFRSMLGTVFFATVCLMMLVGVPQ
jgi:hypothetical protein